MSRKQRGARLLDPARWDPLPLLGSGFTAQVRAAGELVVKIAHPQPECRARLLSEIRILRQGAGYELGAHLPALIAHREDGAALVRERVEGPSLLTILEKRGSLSHRQEEALALLHRRAAAYCEARPAVLDLKPQNLIWVAARRRFVLIDAGPNRNALPFARLARDDLLGAYDRYLAGTPTRRIRPLLVPPSGRFHVEVPVGPLPKGEVLWRNDALLSRIGWQPSDDELLRLTNLSTLAPRTTTARIATRYQDSGRGDEAGGARGDGRSIHLGEIPGGPAGAWEVMLKGCGPTPLAWSGHAFHEDGLLASYRALWETAIADELARLGIADSEIAAVLWTGKKTDDAVKKGAWAFSLVRVSSTHWRLGHLVRAAGDRAAFADLIAHVGRKLVRADFDPDRRSHVGAMARQFASNLGFAIGKTDALDIHGFNPTLGNVTVHGRLLDFSTVRFFRHYLPDFRFLQGKRRAEIHRMIWETQLVRLCDALSRGRLLGARQAAAMGRTLRGVFARRYVDGYLDGLGCFFGGPLGARAGQAERTRLVSWTRKLRALRSNRSVELPHYHQTCPAPWLDLESRTPELIAAWRRGRAEPWSALRLDASAGGAPSGSASRAEQVARTWFEALARAVRREELGRFTPRTWEQVIRPQMEAERLVELCDDRARGKQFEAWRRMMSSRA